MPKITWDPRNTKESEAVIAASDIYRKHGYLVKGEGLCKRSSTAHTATLTFELPPTSFEHILKEAPWDT